jgi:molecular chaperone DnaK (HSP70)
MTPGYVAAEIGDNDLTNEKTNKKLARFIVKTLKEEHSIDFKNLQPWSLSVE